MIYVEKLESEITFDELKFKSCQGGWVWLCPCNLNLCGIKGKKRVRQKRPP